MWCDWESRCWLFTVQVAIYYVIPQKQNSHGLYPSLSLYLISYTSTTFIPYIFISNKQLIYSNTTERLRLNRVYAFHGFWSNLSQHLTHHHAYTRSANHLSVKIHDKYCNLTHTNTGKFKCFKLHRFYMSVAVGGCVWMWASVCMCGKCSCYSNINKPANVYYLTNRSNLIHWINIHLDWLSSHINIHLSSSYTAFT